MWSKCIDFSISLTQVIRQSESEFLALLDEVRQDGCLSPNAIDMLNSLTCPIEWMEEETVLKLFPHQEKVQEENNKLLNNLPGETHTFIAIDFRSAYVTQFSINTNQYYFSHMFPDCIAIHCSTLA